MCSYGYVLSKLYMGAIYQKLVRLNKNSRVLSFTFHSCNSCNSWLPKSHFGKFRNNSV